MPDVIMPQLGETVTEGTVTKWLKSVGEQVARDEPLFEVSTDKVDSEVPSPAEGVLSEIIVQEGDTVDVGERLAVISGDGAGAPSASAGTETPAPPSGSPAPASPPPLAQAAPPPPPPAPAPAPAGIDCHRGTARLLGQRAGALAGRPEVDE